MGNLNVDRSPRGPERDEEEPSRARTTPSWVAARRVRWGLRIFAGVTLALSCFFVLPDHDYFGDIKFTITREFTNIRGLMAFIGSVVVLAVLSQPTNRPEGRS